MVDKPANQDGSISNPEGDWGADWDAAFEAEEDAMFSFDEGEYEKLFKQAPNLPTEGTFVSGDSSAPPEQVKKATKPSFARSLPLLAVQILRSIPARIKNLYNSPQLLTRIFAYLLPAILCVYFLITLFLPAKISPPIATSIPAAAPDTPGPFAILEKTALRKNAGPDLENQHLSPEELTSLAPGEKVRKKWLFSPFLIPASPDGEEDKISFVSIELTLIMLMDAEKPLPKDKKTLLRDIIYQFYANHPLYELRRYSLARGEMNRKLCAWLQKQMPDLPLETVIFNHYQVS